MRYRLAGAYDSNVALLLATGADRVESWSELVEIFRRTTLRGMDLATNLEFHYGILMWFLARDPWAKPTTKFVVPYLTLVGRARAGSAGDRPRLRVPADRARARRAARRRSRSRRTRRGRSSLKETLARAADPPPVRRAALPVGLALAAPARLRRARRPASSGSGIPSRCSPRRIALVNMDADARRGGATASGTTIATLLDRALGLLPRSSAARVPARTTLARCSTRRSRGDEPAFGFDDATWTRAPRGAPRATSSASRSSALLPLDRRQGRLLRPDARRRPHDRHPERLHDPKHQDAMRKVLVPPPATKADEIVAAMGGTFYPQEAPHSAALRRGRRALREGRSALHHRGHEDVQQGARDVRGHRDRRCWRESGVRRARRVSRSSGSSPDEVAVEEDPAERERRMRTTHRALRRTVIADPRLRLGSGGRESVAVGGTRELHAAAGKAGAAATEVRTRLRGIRGRRVDDVRHTNAPCSAHLRISVAAPALPAPRHPSFRACRRTSHTRPRPKTQSWVGLLE